MKMARLFTAIELDDPNTQQLQTICAPLKKHYQRENPNWTQPNNLHLTLRFLGNLPENSISHIITALRTEIKLTPFMLVFNKIMLFPPRSHRLLVATAHLDHELAMLFHQVDRTLSELAPRDPRPFVPHITLARAEHAFSNFIEQPLAISQPVTHICLYRSHLTNSGSQYEILERFDFDNC